MNEMPEELKKKRDKEANVLVLENYDEDCLGERTQPGVKVGECVSHVACGCTLTDFYKEGFNACYELMKEREAKLVEALKFECGNRCAEQNPCNAKQTLKDLGYG